MTTPGVLLLDDAGRALAATPAATALLGLAAEEVAPALRALSGRVRFSEPVVIGLAMQGPGRVVLTGARAGGRLTVIVEAQPGTGGPAAVGSLSPRESEVLELVRQGLATKRIAALLAITPWTVQQHLQSIFAKTGVGSRGELIALVYERAGATA